MPIFPNSIFDFVAQEEAAFQTREIKIADNWFWNFAQHVSLSFHFKHSKYLNSPNDPKTKLPFQNIILPILEYRYSAEDRDVKDIVFETEDTEKQHLSFL